VDAGTFLQNIRLQRLGNAAATGRFGDAFLPDDLFVCFQILSEINWSDSGIPFCMYSECCAGFPQQYNGYAADFLASAVHMVPDEIH